MIARLRIQTLQHLALRLGVDLAELETLGNSAREHYRPFSRTRTNNGRVKRRVIDNPDEQLKHVQSCIQKKLLAELELPENLFGGVRGRTALANARRHAGAAEIVKVDARDFFHCVRSAEVYRIWKVLLCCSPDVARLLTKLTTFRFCLPQGAPTSTTLANLALLDADGRISVSADELSLVCSRFVDDVCVSGADARKITNRIVEVLHGAGKRVRRPKVEVLPRHRGMQVITGYNVSGPNGATIPLRWRDRLRAMVQRYECLAAGRDKDLLKRSIEGSLRHLSVLHPRQAEKLRRRFISAS